MRHGSTTTGTRASILSTHWRSSGPVLYMPPAMDASSAAQRGRQRDAFDRELRAWRRWRRTTLTWHQVAEFHGRLYRPRHSAYDADRYHEALQPAVVFDEFDLNDDDLLMLEADEDDVVSDTVWSEGDLWSDGGDSDADLAG